uniref:Uncharacterized protein n=1 Tax=Cuerna arida TaxID=1464854 RepID=A0A1B6H525_9HEMI
MTNFSGIYLQLPKCRQNHLIFQVLGKLSPRLILRNNTVECPALIPQSADKYEINKTSSLSSFTTSSCHTQLKHNKNIKNKTCGSNLKIALGKIATTTVTKQLFGNVITPAWQLLKSGLSMLTLSHTRGLNQLTG